MNRTILSTASPYQRWAFPVDPRAVLETPCGPHCTFMNMPAKVKGDLRLHTLCRLAWVEALAVVQHQ